MNVVLIRHEANSNLYLFSVPEGKKLEKGEEVIVKNSRGRSRGKCACNSFDANDEVVDALMLATKAKTPLAPVVAVVRTENWEVTE